MRTRSMMVSGVLMLVLTSCGGTDDTTATGASETSEPALPTETAETTEPTEAAAAASTVAVATSDLGDILVDGDGMTLYVFLPDEGGTPTCTDQCLENWPAFPGPADAGEGVDAGLLGTAEHPTGVTMATYNSWPLYYFAGDESPGDTNGQGLGEKWYVIGPDGEMITGAAAASTVAVATSDLGDILVDGDGMTLYVFLPDEGGTPTCTDQCLENWPAFPGPADAGEGVDAGLLGTAEHPTGVTMATYNSWPLYYFAGDESPGDTNGQGLGEKWYVIGPDGEMIDES